MKTSQQTSHRCSNCGAELTLDQNHHSVTCIYCGFQDAPEEKSGGVELFYNMYEDLEIPFMSKKSFSKKCSSCSAEITATLQTISNVCPFCNSTYTVSETAEKSLLQPQNISPFRVTKENVTGFFEKWTAGRKSAPNDFKTSAHISTEFTAVYYPFWTFDIDSTFTFSTPSNAKKKKSQAIKWSEDGGEINAKEDDILIRAHRAVSQEIIDSISDWNLQKLSRFSPALLNQYHTLNYEVEYKRAYQFAKSNLERKRKWEAKRSVDSSGSYKIIFRNEKTTFKYILLPIIISSYSYKGESYPLYINGETGTMGGETPVSKLKANFIFYLFGALVGVIIIALLAAALFL